MAQFFKTLFTVIDSQMNALSTMIRTRIGSYFPYISGVLMVLLLAIFVKMTYSDKPEILAEVIHNDLGLIMQDLADIDASCNILSIRSDHCVVDFLTVERFEGSMVGELNLAYPNRWRGPYRKKNPSVQDRFYEIIKVKDGYVLVPGAGVNLPNKAVVGTDIIIKETMSADDLIGKSGLLIYNNFVLGRKLPFKIGDWDNPITKNRSLKKMEETLEQFNEALSFSQRSEPEIERFTA